MMKIKQIPNLGELDHECIERAYEKLPENERLEVDALALELVRNLKTREVRLMNGVGELGAREILVKLHLVLSRSRMDEVIITA